MSEEKIKLPVTYDSSTFVILDDSGEMLIDLEVTVPRTQDIVDGEYTEKAVQKMDAIGNQIADALNTTAELREKQRVAEEALRSALEASSPEYCDKPSMKQSMEFIWNTAAKALAAIA